jgi:hypothetical protein
VQALLGGDIDIVYYAAAIVDANEKRQGLDFYDSTIFVDSSKSEAPASRTCCQNEIQSGPGLP